jgi:hypothetical protein
MRVRSVDWRDVDAIGDGQYDVIIGSDLAYFKHPEVKIE